MKERKIKVARVSLSPEEQRLLRHGCGNISKTLKGQASGVHVMYLKKILKYFNRIHIKGY